MRGVILDNLRSAHNVGSILRTAAALEYDDVALCGVTVTPPAKNLHETSRGRDVTLNWKQFDQTSVAVSSMINKGYRIAALEVNEASAPIAELPQAEHLAFVIGNEANGVGEDVLSLAEWIVHLPLPGGSTGINVSCAFAAGAYWDHMR